MYWFTADWHLDHENIIKFCNRPFDDVQIMNRTIIDNTNKVVKHEDILVMIGDFCFSKKSYEYNARKFRENIFCKNVIFINGNHDESCLKRIFSEVHERLELKIEGEKIICDHYPSRSWNKQHHGSWQLYGHVHGEFSQEDLGNLSPYEEFAFKFGFEKVLQKYNIAKQDSIIEELLEICTSTKGCNYALDVGVDNPYRKEMPFGTPWSFDEVSRYMNSIYPKWVEKSMFYNMRKKSTNLVS